MCSDADHSQGHSRDVKLVHFSHLPTQQTSSDTCCQITGCHPLVNISERTMYALNFEVEWRKCKELLKPPTQFIFDHENNGLKVYS